MTMTYNITAETVFNKLERIDIRKATLHLLFSTQWLGSSTPRSKKTIWKKANVVAILKIKPL